LGWHPDKFAEAYNANLAEASIEIAESDVVAPAIIALMEMVAAGKKPDSGEGHGRQGMEVSATGYSRPCRSMKRARQASDRQPNVIVLSVVVLVRVTPESAGEEVRSIKLTK